jgi:hypothetical protein
MSKMRIKDIEVINSQQVIINGNLFVQRASFANELEALYNHIHFIINHALIIIKGDGDLTGHHAIPVFLNSRYNVLVPVHEACHDDINKKRKRKFVGIT